MAKRFDIKISTEGRFQAQLDLADVLDEFVVNLGAGWDYCTAQVVGTPTWGSGSVEFLRSNDGVHGLDFPTPVADFTGSTMSALQTVQGVGFLHFKVASSATPTTASGLVTVFGKLHRLQ